MRRITAIITALLIVAHSAESQSRDDVIRLAELGQVWGFLKYFHPGVARGTMNWDSALVASVPIVRAARSSADYNAAIKSLLDAAGPVQKCGDAPATGKTACQCVADGPDSARKNVDFRWMTESKTLGADIVSQLEFVRKNRHMGSGRYIRFINTASFQPDTAFSTPEYPDEGVRLLALFRFWNAARYFFPYMYVNGGDWNAVLPEFIPRLIAARNAEEYHLTLFELSTRLNDAHVGVNSAVITSTLGGRFPSFESRSVEGHIVVWRLGRGTPPDPNGLKVGDVITHVDGESVIDLRRRYTKFVAAGNASVLERKLVGYVVRGRGDSATYVVDRDGKSLTIRVAMTPRPTGTTPTPLPGYPVTELAKVLPGNIGYINMGDINTQQVDSAIAIVKNTAGIVMDVRNYPRGTMYLFAMFFNPKSVPFVKFTSVDSTYPGQVVWTPPYMAGRPNGNPDLYRGRVAILVDERTQSHAEFSVMALRTSPENKVIGSQTAGADGNVTPFVLPGGVRTVFTGLGVYYPDGRPTQRIGIVPDIEVRPTLSGVRAGRDEVLERALEYIRNGR
jgi:carboxyl-terminal processing protease